MTAHRTALLAATALVGSTVAANALTAHFGLVPAGFGLIVTAGTYTAGLALGLRDAVHQLGGVRLVLTAIVVGAVASALTSSAQLALASGLAFLLAELLDLAVYVPLRRRGWRRAVVASNVVGAVADTALFLAVAGFPLTAASLGGQVLVKAVYLTAAALVAVEVGRRIRRAA